MIVVDDSEINRTILSEILKSEYEIIEADSGNTAIEMLQKYRSDIALVLLDVVMPGMDGYSVLEFMNRIALSEYAYAVQFLLYGNTAF